MIVRDMSERKRLEQEREQYFKLFALSVDPTCIADPFGCFKHVNLAFLQLTGYSKDELVSKPFLDFVLPDDRQQTADEMKLQVSGCPSLHFENHCVCKDGKVVLLSWTAYFDKKDGLAYATARDITDRRLNEEQFLRTGEALRSSEAQLREAQRVASVGSWEWYIDTDTNIWSDELYRIFGRDPRIFSPNYYKEHTKLYTPESWARLQVAVEETMRSGTPYELDLEFLRPDGTGGWLVARGEAVRDETGRVIRLRGTALEITERKKAEQMVRSNEIRLRLALRAVNMAVFHQDLALRYTWIYQPQLGYQSGQVVGRTDAELLPPEAARRITELKQRALEVGELAREEICVALKDTTFYYDVIVEPIRGVSGAITGLTGVSLDITERKRAQEVVKETMRRAQALSERVMKVQQEERIRIARELHDELGQTLTALKLHLQMLEPYCADGEAEGHLTEALIITGRALDQVHGMLLDLRPHGLEEFGLVAVLHSHLAKLAEAAGWNSHFESTLPGRLQTEQEITCFRVIQEALTNAMRHAQAKQVWVTLGVNAGEVQFGVRDDGKGFNVAAAFDASPAVAFGLTGMQERVRQMGGRLAIHSALGHGTEVRATFPHEPAGRSELSAGTRA